MICLGVHVHLYIGKKFILFVKRKMYGYLKLKRLETRDTVQGNLYNS